MRVAPGPEHEGARRALYRLALALAGLVPGPRVASIHRIRLIGHGQQRPVRPLVEDRADLEEFAHRDFDLGPILEAEAVDGDQMAGRLALQDARLHDPLSEDHPVGRRPDGHLYGLLVALRAKADEAGFPLRADPKRQAAQRLQTGRKGGSRPHPGRADVTPRTEIDRCVVTHGVSPNYRRT